MGFDLLISDYYLSVYLNYNMPVHSRQEHMQSLVRTYVYHLVNKFEAVGLLYIADGLHPVEDKFSYVNLPLDD